MAAERLLISPVRAPAGLGVEGGLGAAPGKVGGPEQPGSQTPRSSSERTTSGASGGAAPRTAKARRRGGKKKKATVDDIDTLQIRGKVRAPCCGARRGAWL